MIDYVSNLDYYWFFINNYKSLIRILILFIKWTKRNLSLLSVTMLTKSFCPATKRQTLKFSNGTNLADFFPHKSSITTKFSNMLMLSTQASPATRTRTWIKKKFHSCARNLLKNHSPHLIMMLLLTLAKLLEAKGLGWCSWKEKCSSLLNKKSKGLTHLEWEVGPKILQKEILEA